MNNNTLPLTHMDQAMKLKKIGFDWPVSEGFNTSPGYEGRPFGVGRHPSNLNIFDEKVGCISRPTIELALMFLREVKGVDSWVESPHPQTTTNLFKGYKGRSVWLEKKLERFRTSEGYTPECAFSDTPHYTSHPEASSALLDEILKIVKP